MFVRALLPKRKIKMKMSMMRKMRQMPMFPLMPIVPLIVMVTVVSLSILNYRGIKRLEGRFNKVYAPKAH
jgi:hypothetical protein